ncbi:MAG: site-specific DNA-methyltransferase [Anaerolineales bacterium]|nr:site-specific DNA-methyltransferase [Anaerolineales bacterium]
MKVYKPSLNTSVGRWAAIGPYYAMFPLEFAFQVIEKYSKPGQLVIDPFAGRASSIYAAATQGRHGLGVEINPLGWVYAQTKLKPAPLKSVESRLYSILRASESAKYKKQADKLPEFYNWCFSKKVLTFLLAARNNLDWKKNQTDRTLMSFILIYLHGKLGQSLSNQTRQAKAMSQDYSVRWWKKRKLKAPDVDIKDFMLKRIRWRYAKGLPTITSSNVRIGDSTRLLKSQVDNFTERTGKRCSLFFTSPPYYGLTHYHKDQWLRLWVLGGEEKPAWISGKHTGRFDSKVEYKELLENIFSNAAQMMDETGVVYVRTDSREFTKSTTLEILRKHFPDWKEKIVVAPVVTKTQTTILGNRSSKTGEIDIILTKS